MQITLQMIADKVGVSRSTVSLALRNDPQISIVRRREIHRIADDLGYRPNPLISSLMSHLSQTKEPPQRAGLLYLVSGATPTPGEWPGHIFDIYFRCAAEQAARRGFRLESFWMRRPGLTEKRIGGIIDARNIRGVIIGPREDSLPLPRLPWERLAAAFVSYCYQDPPLDRVITNFYNSVRLAMEFLRTIPYSRVCLILPKQHDTNVHHYWTASYLHERLSQPRRLMAPLITTDSDPAIKWAKKNPGGIILGTNLVLRWLTGAGLKPNRDFLFVTLNTEGDRSLTGIEEPSQAIGTNAADMVINRILLNQLGIPTVPQVSLIEPRFQIGHRDPS